MKNKGYRKPKLKADEQKSPVSGPIGC